MLMVSIASHLVSIIPFHNGQNQPTLLAIGWIALL
jgi:hypothetical protein